MAEWKLFDEPPVYSTPEWYSQRERACHAEQEGHRQRLDATTLAVADALGRGGESVVDLGAGDGGLLQMIRQHGYEVPMWGYDLQPSNVAGAVERGVDVTLADFDSDEIRWADIVVVSEVLEHLVDPHAMVARIRNSGARFLVATSPYTETDQSHYGFHLWAWDLDGYRSMIEAAGWRVLDVRTAWISQIVLAERAA